jgi:rubrerythrin
MSKDDIESEWLLEFGWRESGENWMLPEFDDGTSSEDFFSREAAIVVQMQLQITESKEQRAKVFASLMDQRKIVARCARCSAVLAKDDAAVGRCPSCGDIDAGEEVLFSATS